MTKTATATENAWRTHFTNNAANLLCVMQWAEGWTVKDLQTFMILCFHQQAPRDQGRKINTRTVENVLELRLRAHQKAYPECWDVARG